MNVVTLENFHDNLNDVDRKRGEEFVVSRDRFEEINRIGVEKIGVPLVEEAKREEEAGEARGSRAPKAASKRRAGKAE